MEACARWFSLCTKDENHQSNLDQAQHHPDERSNKDTAQILLFNCMSVRDPQLLLPRLMKTCASHGVHFKKALFVPNISVYNKVGSHALPTVDPQVDLSWQFAFQRVLENLMQGDRALADEEPRVVFGFIWLALCPPSAAVGIKRLIASQTLIFASFWRNVTESIMAVIIILGT